MKKKLVCLSLGLCLTLSGCAGLNKSVEQKMFEKSGISADSNYKTYQAYSADGKLTIQGYYSEDVFESESHADTVPTGTTTVSFAKNSCLYISYFTDAEHTEPIDAQSCHLKPGVAIYATVELGRDVASNRYSFTGFRLYQYKNGGRDLIDTIELGEEGFVLEISEDMVGSDYSIEPIGDYGSRVITLRDYYTDANGNEHDLAGTWLVDDEIASGDEVEINPVASYIISYEYDNNEYFYLSSSPKCYYSNNEDGIVIFELMDADATDASFDYSVELCKYLSVDVLSSVERTVTRSSGAEIVVAAGTKHSFTGLKYGDSIVLRTDTRWPQLENCKELVVNGNPLSYGAYEYQIRVPDKDGQFWFDPSEYTYEHGEIGFKWLGEEITEPIQLAPGRIIAYYAKNADKGYWLGDGDHQIVVGSDAETRTALRNISFIPEAKVTVNLPQPEHGGSITYYADGKRLTGTTYTTTSGKEISMDFHPWPGWVNEYKNGETYQVSGDSTQTVKIQQNFSVDTAFVEDEGHMPTLEVVLNKSVGENMKFTITAAADEIDKKECSYSGKWYNNDVTVLPATKIGTYDSIYLEFGKRALESGTAVKLLIELETKDGEKISYHRLVDDLSEKQKPIDIYSASEIGVSKVWYKAIKITVSIVEVETFTAPKKPAHGTVVVRVADTQAALKNGDLIEPSEEVTVTITPSNDYYVTGKNVKNNIYQNKMKFSKYLDDIDDIISEHPIEEYIHLTLAPNDKYGVCTYKLGKEEVSGEIRVKADQELTLTYTVTASGYVIEGGSSGFLGFGKTDTEKSETITITADMNGKTIDRTNFGINVAKGG